MHIFICCLCCCFVFAIASGHHCSFVCANERLSWRFNLWPFLSYFLYFADVGAFQWVMLIISCNLQTNLHRNLKWRGRWFLCIRFENYLSYRERQKNCNFIWHELDLRFCRLPQASNNLEFLGRMFRWKNFLINFFWW